MNMPAPVTPLRWSCTPQGDSRVYALAGCVEAIGAARLLEAITADVANGARHVMLECSGISRALPTALGSLLRAHSVVRAADGRLVFVACSPELRRAFSLTRLSRFFLLAPSHDEALTLLA